MAIIPAALKLTPEQESNLETIRVSARIRHEKARKAWKAKGRINFPLLPFECSWAYEEHFRRNYTEIMEKIAADKKRWAYLSI